MARERNPAATAAADTDGPAPAMRSSGLDQAALAVFAGLIIAFVAACSFVNAHNTSIAYLSVHDVDENAFVFVIDRMFGGVQRHSLMDILNISFFNYGYAYFLSLMAVCAPWLATNHLSGAVFVARTRSEERRVGKECQ